MELLSRSQVYGSSKKVLETLASQNQDINELSP